MVERDVSFQALLAPRGQDTWLQEPKGSPPVKSGRCRPSEEEGVPGRNRCSRQSSWLVCIECAVQGAQSRGPFVKTKQEAKSHREARTCPENAQGIQCKRWSRSILCLIS